MFKRILPVLGLLVFSAFLFKGLSPDPYVFPKLYFFPKMPMPEHGISTEGVELGRRLFYDPILSRDSTHSCASCHLQQAAFADTIGQFSIGVSGQPLSRNTPALYNLAWYPFFHWDGKAESIEGQMALPLHAKNELHFNFPELMWRLENHVDYSIRFERVYGKRPIDSLMITEAIGQFERTLISHRSRFDQAVLGEVELTKNEREGFSLMHDQTKGNCLHCHSMDANALGTTGQFSNNGLDFAKEPADYPDPGLCGRTGLPQDYGYFKTPSLRNIALTGPYMHDGRFETLEEVLEFYASDVQPAYNIDSRMGQHARQGQVLTPEEQQLIITFLHALTDSTFIQDPAFSNPFIHGKE
ncbi:MAG: cytochrome c peroxidase [Bacteroidota bacterium]